jgi:hypothetical protein
MRAFQFLAIVVVAVIQASCKKDDQGQPSIPDPEINKEEYTVEGIEYKAIPGYVAEEIVEQRPSLEYSNWSDLQQKIQINPDNVFEKSLFKRDTLQSYTVNSGSQMFSVPLDVYKDQVSLGAEKWMYLEQDSRLLSTLNFKDSAYVEPRNKLIVDLSIIYKKVKTSYTAHLKEKTSGKLIDLTGTWIGIYPLRKTMAPRAQKL